MMSKSKFLVVWCLYNGPPRVDLGLPLGHPQGVCCRQTSCL